MTKFDVKWPGKGWYSVKQNNQPTISCQDAREMYLLYIHIKIFCVILYPRLYDFK